MAAFAHMEDQVNGQVRIIECAEKYCPAERITKTLRKVYGHLHPITGVPDFDSKSEDYDDGKREYQAENLEVMKTYLFANPFLGQVCRGVTLDYRATSILFFLIWTSALGIPGSSSTHRALDAS